jgi:hypothetical protein
MNILRCPACKTLLCLPTSHNQDACILDTLDHMLDEWQHTGSLFHPTRLSYAMGSLIRLLNTRKPASALKLPKVPKDASRLY